MATQNEANKKKISTTPRLAAQNQRFSPNRGRMNELAKTLSEMTSTSDTSNPHVVPRYQSLLTKLTSINSVTDDNVTIRKKKTSRMRCEMLVSRIPPHVPPSSNASAS